jgi:hypothetical protein
MKKTKTISEKRKLTLIRACTRALKKINIRNREQASREMENNNK